MPQSLTLLFLCSWSLLPASGAIAESDWLNWRGPAGTGTADSAAPVNWSKTENVKWMVEIPERGFSTPIVVGDRLYLTTAVPTGTDGAVNGSDESQSPQRRGGAGGPALREEQRFDVMCLDRATGGVLWARTATTAVPHEGFHRTYGSWASYSPISDGERVIASFGSFGIYCYDLSGELLWSFDPEVKLETRNQFGEGCAPAIWEHTLVQVLDHEGQSEILALNTKNGEVLWRHNRNEPTVWAMPLITKVDDQVQVITSGSNRVRAYDIRDGRLIWECGGLGSNPIPNPVRHGDAVLAMSGHRNVNLICVALGRTGDLTNTDAVIWNSQRGTAYTCAPILAGGYYYTLSDRGELSCFDPATGHPHYLAERLPRGSQFKSSPIEAGGKLYMADENGRVHVLAAGPEFKLLAMNEMEGEFFVASPIVVDGHLYLRSSERLFCVSASEEALE